MRKGCGTWLGALRCDAKVVYLSTDYVFDGTKGEPYVENDLPNPLNVYGRSKLQGRAVCSATDGRWGHCSNPVAFWKAWKQFCHVILRQAREKKELSIVDDQTGSPTYTVDLAKAISALVQHDAKGIFHVVNSGTCTWFTFGQSILEFSGMAGVRIRPISSKELNRPAVRPPYSGLELSETEAGDWNDAASLVRGREGISGNLS